MWYFFSDNERTYGSTRVALVLEIPDQQGFVSRLRYGIYRGRSVSKTNNEPPS